MDDNRYVWNADEGCWVDTVRHRFVDAQDVMNDQARELDRLRRKSRAHRKSLKDQQRAIMERNSQIAHLDAALCALFPVAQQQQPEEKAPVRGYLEEQDYPHEDVSKDLTKPLTYKVTRER